MDLSGIISNTPEFRGVFTSSVPIEQMYVYVMMVHSLADNQDVHRG